MFGIRARMHPTLDILVNSIGQVFIPDCHGSYRWTFGTITPEGYMQVQIDKKLYLVHRLVAETFLQNPEGKPEVDHRDRNRSNNCVDNLKWATHSENQRNRSCVDAVTARGIPHSYEDEKAYDRARRKEYVAKNPETAVRWFKTHKKVRMSDGSDKYFPIETAQQLLKLPVKDRVI